MEKIVLARHEYPDGKLSSHLVLDGHIEIWAMEVGLDPKTGDWNDRDWDGGVAVPAHAVPKLAFELLKEKYAGNLGPVHPFQAWCQEHGVAHEFDSW
jgi:hypothetical protein